MSRGSIQTLRQVLPGARRLVVRFWPLWRGQRGLIAAAFATLIGGVAMRLLEPWPLKFVFDYVLQTSTRRGGRLPDVEFVRALDPSRILLLAAAGVVTVVGLRAVADYFTTVLFATIGNRVMARVRDDTYRHVQRLPMSFHTGARGGDLILRVIGDVNQMRDAVVTAVLPLVANVLVLAGMWGVMFWLHARLALLALCVTPLLSLRTVRLGYRIRDAARVQRQRQGAMASTAAESIGAIKVVQALSLEDAFADEFSRRNNDSRKQDVKTARLSARLERGVDVLIACATAAVLYYGTLLALRGALSPGELIVFLAYLRKAFNPVQDFAKYTGRLAKATAAGERVLDLLDRTQEVCDLPGAAPAPPLRGHVRLEGVTFAYEADGRPALRDLSFEVRPGQRVALVGPSGGGKSTIVSLLLRLYDPQAGRVTVDGRDVREYTLDSLRRQVSIVLQESVLFARSVRENIAHGAPGATPADVEAAARVANAHEFILALAQGYDTVLGERGVTLSGGQRQRIAIARAAVRRAPIVVYDEPTTGLDKENERDVIAALERLAEGRTTVLVSHDLRLVSRCDLILYIDGGRILEAGSHDDLIAAGGPYAHIWRVRLADIASGRDDGRAAPVLDGVTS